MTYSPGAKHTPEWERARYERFLELWGSCWGHDHLTPGRRNPLRKGTANRQNCPTLLPALEQLDREIPAVTA